MSLDRPSLGCVAPIIVVGILVAGIVSAVVYNPQYIADKASTNAQEYVESLNRAAGENTYSFVSCSSDDHDRDNYATCSIMNKNNPKKSTEPISCTYGWFSSGCKPWTPKPGTVAYPSDR